MPVQDGPAIFMQLTLDDTRVLRWVAASLTQPEIARKLGISVDTVKHRVSRVERPTGTRTMRELERWWRRWRDDWYVWLDSQTRLDDDVTT